MLKKLINIGLATTVILGSLGTISYAVQTPISPDLENNIAQTSVKPNPFSVVTEGFDKLCSGRTRDAYTLWMNNSFPALQDVMAQSKESLVNTQETMLGKCIRYIMIGSVSLTEKTQIVYLESEHEKAPVFWEFVVYHNPQRWEISSFSFNTSPHKIIPPSLLNNSKDTLVTHKS